LITEHFDGGILPEIPGELLVKLFSHKNKEQALGIRQDYTHWWTGKNLIPDSDGLVAMIEDQQKRERSDTVSTTLADKPASKSPDIKVYQSLYRVNISPIGNCKRSMKFSVICFEFVILNQPVAQNSFCVHSHFHTGHRDG
jgi:hypothetical protein